MTVMTNPNIDIAKHDYTEFKAAVARCGRAPEHVRMTQLINTVSAATKAEAEDKWAEISKLPIEIDALSLLSDAEGYSFEKLLPKLDRSRTPLKASSRYAGCIDSIWRRSPGVLSRI